MKQFSKDLGNVSLAPKGRWSKEQEYEKLALVYNACDNLSYVAKINVPSGVDIENREYWQPMNATGYADNNFINLTAENENGTITAYETLEEAVATILPINRRAGATLSFYNLNSDRLDRQAEFELWQFNSTDLANWENRDYWNNIYYNWNVFAGWYIGADGLKNHVKIPNVGQYAYVGTNLNDALLYQCRTNGVWTNTGIKVRNYISVVVSGNITIGENGNWFSDGKDTGIPATPAVDEQLDDIIIQLQQHTTEISNLKKADANLQDQITSNDSDITSLTAKHKSLSNTVQGIAATGGASTATNVTYNNDSSGLNAENAQDAIDEVGSIGHFAKRGGIVNISTNYNSTNTAEVLTLPQALSKVPSTDRVLGFVGTFLTQEGWKTYKFAGATISDWNNTDYWYTESVNDVITGVGSGILKINTNEGYIQISGYILSDFSATSIPSQKIAFNFDSTIHEFYTIYLDYSNNLKVVKFIGADTGEVKKIVCRFNTTETGKIAIDYSIVPTIDINGTIVSIFDYLLNNVLDSNSNTLNNLVLYKSYEYNYINTSGVIEEYTGFFHVTNLIKVTPSLKIMQACAPNVDGIVGVKYNKNFTQIGLITKSTSELVSNNGAYYFDLVYEDYSDAEYIILNVDDRAHFSISNFVMLGYDYLIRTQRYSYFNEPSNTIEGASGYLYIDSDYNQFIIGLHDCIKLAINRNVIIADQKITISKREDVDIEYYIAYLDEELTLHCTAFNAAITDNAIIIARFSVKKSSEVNISYSRCPVTIVNGSRIGITGPVDSNIYESGYNYIGKEEVLPYTSNYKVSKLLYVTQDIKITHACQANSSVCAALLYDENLNKIGEVKSTVESPVSSTEFIVDISYDNVKNASYIRFCTNYDKYPSAIYNAEVVSQFHIDNINKKAKLLSHNIYMEEDTKGFELNPEYTNKLYTKYDVFQREVTAVNVLLNARVNTDILLFNSITNSNTVIQTIKGSTINAGEYNFIILDKPIYIRANQYIGFSRNVSWITNSHNNVGGSVIASTKNNGFWEQQKTVVFCYGLYYNNPNTNLIRKSISVMGDSISTDNYVTNPEKVYWKRLSNTCDLKRIGKSIQGGTCIMTGLRPDHAVPFTSQTRWGNLFSNGTTGDSPDIILIFGGVNDFGTTPADGDVFLKYAELGTMSDIGSDDPSLSFYAAYSYLLRKLIETYTNVQIICCTPIKMWAYGGRLTSYYPLTNIHGLKMEDFVQAIKDCARTYGAQVVDLFNDYPANQTNYLSYHKDVYHPKEEGYAVIEELILNAIKNRL